VSDTGSSTILPAVEQRIGSKSQPLDAAAVNPAYIPGLTSPVPAESKEAAAEGAAAEEAVSEEAVSEEAVSKEVSSEEGASEETGTEAAVTEAEVTEAELAETAGADETPAAEAPSAAEVTDEEADPSPESDAEPDPDRPAFEASDRRASIKADHSGVQLRLDDQQAEFRWEEIGAVETETPRFGKRFTITVHTPDRRWYPIEIEATARARFKEWEDQLDAVLDAYFEEGESVE
jgi:hypothetical protein